MAAFEKTMFSTTWIKEAESNLVHYLLGMFLTGLGSQCYTFITDAFMHCGCKINIPQQSL